MFLVTLVMVTFGFMTKMKKSKQYYVEIKTPNEVHFKLTYWGASPEIAAMKAINYCYHGDKTRKPWYFKDSTIIRVKESRTPRLTGITFFKLADFNIQ